jgi:glyoxylase-like metal-dependent hydrolase (beta-lactamase superfamily II)
VKKQPKTLIVIFLIISCSVLSAQEVFKNSDLTISKLEQGVWVVETTDMATMYIIEGTERAMLIDVGTQCEKLDEVVRKITNKPLIVVLTHYHPDHAGNIRYFDEVYMHPLDTAIKLDIEFNGKFRWLQDGDVFDLGNRKIEVAWLPGHTPGSIVLLDRTINAAYIGDTYGSGQIWLHLHPTSPMKTYYESCVRMEKIMREQNITKLYVGHYPLFKRPLTLNYIVDMKDLAKRLSEGNTNGSTPYRMPFQSDLATDNPAVITNGTATIVFDPQRAN